MTLNSTNYWRRGRLQLRRSSSKSNANGQEKWFGNMVKQSYNDLSENRVKQIRQKMFASFSPAYTYIVITYLGGENMDKFLEITFLIPFVNSRSKICPKNEFLESKSAKFEK